MSELTARHSSCTKGLHYRGMNCMRNIHGSGIDILHALRGSISHKYFMHSPSLFDVLLLLAQQHRPEDFFSGYDMSQLHFLAHGGTFLTCSSFQGHVNTGKKYGGDGASLQLSVVWAARIENLTASRTMLCVNAALRSRRPKNCPRCWAP